MLLYSDVRQWYVSHVTKDFYDKTWLVTPYSSQFITRDDMEPLHEFNSYSFQAASLATRLSNMVWDDYGHSNRYQHGEEWFDYHTKRNIVANYLLNSSDTKYWSLSNQTIDNTPYVDEAQSMTNDQLDDYMSLILEKEGEKTGSQLDHNLVHALIHIIIVDNGHNSNWDLLSYHDKVKLLYVYGIVGSNYDQDSTDDDQVVITHDHLNMLKRLQLLCAQEIEVFNPESMRWSTDRGLLNLLHNLITLSS